VVRIWSAEPRLTGQKRRHGGVVQPFGSRYVLHDVLGRGAMGEVFRGAVRESGAPVAVKILRAELVGDSEIVSRFVRERSILTSISHPNVVRVIDLVVEGDTLGIVMEMVRGKDLRRSLTEEHTQPPAAAVQLCRQLLAGLKAVHAVGVVHRDIKPENILLDFYDSPVRVKLTDFGIARLTYGTALTRTSGVIGTPEYMAPETAQDGTATSAADLYSTGIVLYEMLAGRTPFRGGPPLTVLRRHAEEPPPAIPGLPPRLWAYVESLLAKDPSARPASAKQAADILLALEPELAGLPSLPPMTQVSAPRSSSRMSPPAGSDQVGSPAASLAGAADRGTVLRHRHRGSLPDEIPGPAPEHSRSYPPGAAAFTGGRQRRSRLLILSVAAAAAAAAAIIGLLHMRSPSHPSAAPPRQPMAAYTFPPQRYRTGLVATRRWTLTGKDGTLLTETITFRSATGKALTTWFKDTIPTAITSTMQTLAITHTTQAVRFSIIPAKITTQDPVVEWYLRLPAHGNITVGYVAYVAPRGATTARLASWAKDLDAVEERLNTPAPTTRLSATPPAPASTPESSAAPTSIPGNPWPTYGCAPQGATCSPNAPGSASPSPSAGSGF
jgi:serine/threonine protein kinase